MYYGSDVEKKSRSRGQENTNQHVMASKYNLKAYFDVFWNNFIKIFFFFQSISVNKKHGVKCFANYSKSSIPKLFY